MSLLSAVAPVGESPVDWWLAEQADLSAVERFAQRHEGEQVPRQARYYRDLIPLAQPEPGQQFGFEVDLDACTGCKACVTACHSLNGLDDDESWRSVMLLTGGTAAKPFQQTVTAACHHCVDPACLKGCPVDAYEKDPITGIVSHLDDQCIGCSYCTLSCPYEVPAYNHRRGIVRKCDMCKGRLAAGEAPACVQACPSGAIAIKVVDITALVANAAGVLVPGAAPSAITVPSTVYRSAHGRVHELPAAASSAAGPAHAHPSLAVMLVLTQLAVGAFVTDLLLRVLTNRGTGVLPMLDAVMVAAAGVLALAASVLHLGRPWYCYRAVIGLRHSWLSREVVAFGAFTGLGAPYALVLWLARSAESQALPQLLGGAVALFGIAGVACSVLIYTTTHRSSWRPSSVASKFALSAAVCGLATVIWASTLSAMLRGSGVIDGPDGVERPLLVILAVLMAVKLTGEASVLRHLVWAGDLEGARRARLLTHDLRTATLRRFAVGLSAGVALPLLLAAMSWADVPSWLAVVTSTLMVVGVAGGELLERSLFFTAASSPR